MCLRKYRSSPAIIFFLWLMFLCGTHAPFVVNGLAQHQQRERRVDAPPHGATIQEPTTTPRPAASPITSPTPTRTPAPAATPLPVATSRVAASAPQTVEELRLRIQEILRQPQLAASHVAVKVASLDTGRVLFEENAQKWLQPASNMKLFAVAAALDRLTPDYRFHTSVYAQARPDAGGKISGDLIIYGRGDPTLATRFNETASGTTSRSSDPATENSNAQSHTGHQGDTYFKAIDELAARIVAAGVRRIEGDLVGDETYFTGSALPLGWEWGDLQWYYGAPVSALSINDNAIDLIVRPGARAGSACVVTTGPSLPQDIVVLNVAAQSHDPKSKVLLSTSGRMEIINRATTAPRGTPQTLAIFRPLGANVIEVSGQLPLGDAGLNASIAVPQPAWLFTTMLRRSLERQGVVITGQTRTIEARARDGQTLPTATLVEIAHRQSPPLRIIAAQTLKPSQNLYAELILRALGKATGTKPTQTTDEAGLEAVGNFLRQAGIDESTLVMFDGSGLSRSNLVTAATTLELLIYMNGHRDAAVFRDAQPVAGVDGTLRNRMRNTPAANNARAKTGTLSSATSLSGYLTSASGERLVFSLIINNPARQINPRATFTDAITVLLASFMGRS